MLPQAARAKRVAATIHFACRIGQTPCKWFTSIADADNRSRCPTREASDATPLAIGKRRNRRVGQQLVGRALYTRIEMRGQPLRERRTDVLATPIDAANRFQQLIGRMILREVARGPSLERSHRPLVFGVNAQDQDPDGRMAGSQVPKRLEKGTARHRHVEQHKIGGCSLERGNQRRRVARLTRNHQTWVRFDDTAQSLPDDRMVVGNEDPNRGPPRSAHGPATGIVTTIAVPSPGLPRINRVPPQANARSRMPTNPRDRRPLSDWGTNPTPLSSTARMMFLATRSTVTSTRVALECRVTLVSASWMIRKA